MSPTPAAPVEVYSTRTTNWPALLLIVALAVPFVGFGLSSDASLVALVLPALAIVIVVAGNVLTNVSLRVTTGPQGVGVHFGVFGWPRFRYAARRIARVEATAISPWASAWGICWTPRDGLRLTLRAGPALRLTLAGGRRVTINVDDPDRAIAALSAGLRP